MHHPVLVALLVVFLVSRFVARRRCSRGGGGCGGRRWGGPIDLGAPDGDTRRLHRFSGFGHARHHARFARFSRRFRREAAPARSVPVDVAGTLELNQRQRELFDEVMAKAKPVLSVEALAEALAAVGREPFDRATVEAAVRSPELADDLEHLHHSLLPEQRAKLRAVTRA